MYTYALDFCTTFFPRSIYLSQRFPKNVGGVGGDLGLGQVDARDLADSMGIPRGFHGDIVGYIDIVGIYLA